MSNDSQLVPIPTAVRVAGGIVIIASVVTTLLGAVFVLSPSRMKGDLLATMLASMVISGVGGLCLLAARKNWLWIVTLVPVIAVLVFWLLLAQAARVMFH